VQSPALRVDTRGRAAPEQDGQTRGSRGRGLFQSIFERSMYLMYASFFFPLTRYLVSAYIPYTGDLYGYHVPLVQKAGGVEFSYVDLWSSYRCAGIIQAIRVVVPQEWETDLAQGLKPGSSLVDRPLPLGHR
jgi:hypothetical protein